MRIIPGFGDSEYGTVGIFRYIYITDHILTFLPNEYIIVRHIDIV
jgi:hypothetical protein